VECNPFGSGAGVGGADCRKILQSAKSDSGEK
jgi:hypothetical protein